MRLNNGHTHWIPVLAYKLGAWPIMRLVTQFQNVQVLSHYPNLALLLKPYKAVDLFLASMHTIF